MPSSRQFLKALAATVGLTLVAVLLTLTFPSVLPGVEPVLAISMLIVAYLVVSLACAVTHERGRVQVLMRTGALVGLLSLIGWIVGVATDQMYQTLSIDKVMIWPSMWACLMLVVAVMHLPRARTTLIKAMRGLTMGLAALLALSIAVTVTFEPGWNSYGGYNYRYEDIAERIMAALSLLTGGAGVITFLCIGLPTIGGQAQPEAPVLPYWLECPRCGAPQQATTGSHQCERCALTVRLEVT